MAFPLLVMILVAQIVLCYDGTAAAAGGATSAADFRLLMALNGEANASLRRRRGLRVSRRLRKQMRYTKR